MINQSVEILNQVDGETSESEGQIINDAKNRMVCELHDEVISNLTLASMQLEVLKLHKEVSALVLSDLFGKLEEKLNYSIAALRGIIFGMSGELLEPSLDNNIRRLCSEFNALKKIQVNYSISGVEGSLSKSQTYELVQIIKELLINSFKHSEAKEINIRCNWTGDILDLMYSDNGKGFSLDISTLKHSSFGINSIMLRSKILSGECQFYSSAAGMNFNLNVCTKSVA